MTKISINTKIKAIQEYAKGIDSLMSVAKKYGIARFDFQILVGIYARFGKEVLLHPPVVTGDFRMNLVKWKQTTLASIAETCIHFAYHSPSPVYQWECLYNKQGPQALLRLRPGRKLKNGQSSQRTSIQQTASTPKAESSSPKRKLIIKDTTRRLKKLQALRKHPTKKSRK